MTKIVVTPAGSLYQMERNIWGTMKKCEDFETLVDAYRNLHKEVLSLPEKPEVRLELTRSIHDAFVNHAHRWHEKEVEEPLLDEISGGARARKSQKGEVPHV